MRPRLQYYRTNNNNNLVANTKLYLILETNEIKYCLKSLLLFTGHSRTEPELPVTETLCGNHPLNGLNGRRLTLQAVSRRAKLP